MDAFDYVETQQTPRRNFSGLIFNLLTILVIIGVLCVGAVFLMIFLNPQVAFNPYKPPTRIPTIALPTSTPPAVIQLDPTWTPTPSAEPTATLTPRPTNTPLFTETPTATVAIETPQATLTPGGMSFVLQQGSPKAISNIYDLDAGCDWMGVGGQALDMTGAPVVGLIVQLGGTLEDNSFEDVFSMTGTALQLGPGGFIFQLADHPIPSQGKLWVQLLDQQLLPLSDKLYFDTYADCGQNLIVIQFKQVK
jgi:hypothetical protein